ncbi:MAG TPA: DUF72 domain-containing protein [Caulobacteraceae bacterium]
MSAERAWVRVGTAGWAIPAHSRAAFPGHGSVLERYAGRFSAVEINSSFYRPHRTATYERWAVSTPPAFRFSVKLPKIVTHDMRLRNTETLVTTFLSEVGALGEKLGPILVQLPPSLIFEEPVASAFFKHLRDRTTGQIACEPRHGSWFNAHADGLLANHRVARAAVDPPVHPAARRPGGWRDLAYWRWHGAPRVYHSQYSDEDMGRLLTHLREGMASETWCILDNTALGAATTNALSIVDSANNSARRAFEP